MKYAMFLIGIILCWDKCCAMEESKIDYKEDRSSHISVRKVDAIDAEKGTSDKISIAANEIVEEAKQESPYSDMPIRAFLIDIKGREFYESLLQEDKNSGEYKKALEILQKWLNDNEWVE